VYGQRATIAGLEGVRLSGGGRTARSRDDAVRYDAAGVVVLCRRRRCQLPQHQ